MWGNGPRNFLFVPDDSHDHVERILNGKLHKLKEQADKTLYTDRPLAQ